MDQFGAAINKAFFTMKKPRTEHYRVPPLHADQHSLMIKRVHNTIKERTKVMRGMHPIETGTPLMWGWRIYYNFLREHVAIGMTPAKAAGIDLPFEGGWGDLIQWATVHHTRSDLFE